VAELPEPDSVQEVGLKAPVLVEAQLETVPVGVVGVLLVSVTVAVQVVGALTATELGEQLTVVVVVCLVLKVAVVDWAELFILKLQTGVVPEHGLPEPLQLAKNELAFGLAVNVMSSVLPVVTEQVPELGHVLLSLEFVVSVTMTVPPPVPEKFIVSVLFATV
jgi:hypothetical protein